MANITQFISGIEDTLSNVEKRPFDAYLLGPFLIWYGMKSKKMGKWPRRIILTAGIYQLMYNWNKYRSLYVAISQGPNALATYVVNEKIPDEVI